ncbi:MAG: type II toxin-antitoxin system VapC family toxin [Trueperaceae bacterium]
MILYLDTSAIVASYFYEPHTATVSQATLQATQEWVSLIAYVETKAAFAQLKHQRRLVGKSYYQALKQFEEDWQTFDYYDISEEMVQLAASLAETFILKGYDAMHLASALRLQKVYKDLRFLSYDVRLNRAASSAGLTLWV